MILLQKVYYVIKQFLHLHTKLHHFLELLKELYEASVVFDEAELSAAFFGGKYVFLMIPYKGDMFEASNMHVPVATKQHAMHCKKEIEQILEIIDVFDLYKNPVQDKAVQDSADQDA